MADENEDLVVTLGESEPEIPSKGDVAKPPPVPGPSSSVAAPVAPVAPDVGLKDLEQQIANERRERERLTAETRRLQAERDQAVQYAQEADRRGGTNYEAYVDSQIQGMSEQMDVLAVQSETAMNDGDFKTVAEINKKVGRIGGALALAEREKLALQQQREQQARQPKPQPKPAQSVQPQAQLPTDPLERAIHGRSEPTKAFLRKHPDLIRGDGTLKAVAIQAHERALDDGMRVDTDAYFQHIEKILGSTMQSNGAENGAENGARPVQIPGYSAPISRGPNIGGDNLAPGTFRMTPKMRRLAEEQGVTPQEWANNYVRLLKEGRVTPIT